jgi:PAS domain S-box-containing protein
MISVLYVDDEIALLEICKLFLERTGEFSVHTECSPQQALDSLREGGYDAVVSDYQMPEMDGIEFLKKVRESGNSIPFITFTGKGREEIAIAAFENGADFYLQKGGDPKSQFAELAHKIRKSVEQRKSVQTLWENETRFRALIQNTSDIVSIFDRNGSILYISPAAERILGYPDNYYIGKNPLDFIHPEDRDRTKIDLDEVYEKGNPGTPSEYRLRAVDGEYLWVESVAINLIGVPGVDGIVTTTRPITERKRAEEVLRKQHGELHDAFEQLTATEEELRQNYEELAKSQQQFMESEQKVRASEAFLNRVITGVREGITAYDRELRYILWNKFMENLTGIPAADVSGKRAVDEFPFLKEAGADLLQERALSGETVESSDFSFWIPQSGKKGWARAIYSPMYDTEGTIIGVTGIIQDTTAKKVMEHVLQTTIEELMTNEERYVSLLERSLDCIYIHDLEGNFIDANPAALALLGYTKDDIPHLSFTSLISGEQLITARETIRTLVKSGSQPELVEYRLQRKNGGFVDVETKGSLILHDEKPYAILGIARDITKRKRAAEALTSANKKLNLLFGITRHDIRNQLLALRGAIDIIDTDHLDQKTRKLIGIAQKAAETINAQIEFTKEYEYLGLKEPRWQNVSGLFRHATLQFLMFDISLDMPVDEYEIFADPLIEKVFYNLLDNALRHGSNVTRISLSCHEADTGLKILVEDNGQGVPDQDKQLIFQQNFGRNTGLGLFLTREILAITDITIRETGTYGKGARFEITVPKGAYRSEVQP